MVQIWFSLFLLRRLDRLLPAYLWLLGLDELRFCLWELAFVLQGHGVLHVNLLSLFVCCQSGQLKGEVELVTLGSGRQHEHILFAFLKQQQLICSLEGISINPHREGSLSFRLHQREQDGFPNSVTGQVHQQPIDS